jgi:hypothetical protein
MEQRIKKDGKNLQNNNIFIAFYLAIQLIFSIFKPTKARENDS